MLKITRNNQRYWYTPAAGVGGGVACLVGAVLLAEGAGLLGAGVGAAAVAAAFVF